MDLYAPLDPLDGYLFDGLGELDCAPPPPGGARRAAAHLCPPAPAAPAERRLARRRAARAARMADEAHKARHREHQVRYRSGVRARAAGTEAALDAARAEAAAAAAERDALRARGAALSSLIGYVDDVTAAFAALRAEPAEPEPPEPPAPPAPPPAEGPAAAAALMQLDWRGTIEGTLRRALAPPDAVVAAAARLVSPARARAASALMVTRTVATLEEWEAAPPGARLRVEASLAAAVGLRLRFLEAAFAAGRAEELFGCAIRERLAPSDGAPGAWALAAELAPAQRAAVLEARARYHAAAAEARRALRAALGGAAAACAPGADAAHLVAAPAVAAAGAAARAADAHARAETAAAVELALALFRVLTPLQVARLQRAAAPHNIDPVAVVEAVTAASGPP
jgi:hypothetical protein